MKQRGEFARLLAYIKPYKLRLGVGIVCLSVVGLAATAAFGVWVLISVPWATGGNIAEQARGFTFTCETSELVDSGEEKSRWIAIELIIDSGYG